MSDTSSRESFGADHEEKDEKRELPEVENEGKNETGERPEDHDEGTKERHALPEGDHEEKSEEELINELGRKAGSGDPYALEQLFELDAFYTSAQSICGPIARRYQADPQVLFQELFAKIPRIIEDYKATGEFPAWISRIARNLQVDLLRRQNVQKKYDTSYWQRTEGARENSVEERYVNRIAVQKALSSLSAADRRLVELRNMGHTFKDIAGILDMSPSQCYRQWKRVLQLLQHML